MRNELRYYKPCLFLKKVSLQGLSVGSEAIYRLCGVSPTILKASVLSVLFPLAYE